MRIDVPTILRILENGNTAEVKKTKDGVLILEVSRKIRAKENIEAAKNG